jgi:hypothetical protein
MQPKRLDRVVFGSMGGMPTYPSPDRVGRRFVAAPDLPRRIRYV